MRKPGRCPGAAKPLRRSRRRLLQGPDRGKRRLPAGSPARPEQRSRSWRPPLSRGARPVRSGRAGARPGTRRAWTPVAFVVVRDPVSADGDLVLAQRYGGIRRADRARPPFRRSTRIRRPADELLPHAGWMVSAPGEVPGNRPDPRVLPGRLRDRTSRSHVLTMDHLQLRGRPALAREPGRSSRKAAEKPAGSRAVRRRRPEVAIPDLPDGSRAPAGRR